MKETKGGNAIGRMWHLYKTGGLTPAIASMMGASGAQQMAFIRAMSRDRRKEVTLDTPLAEMEAVVFDLETTGFHPYNGDEIISIGAVRIRGAAVLEDESFYRVVNPKRKLPRHIVELTGITSEMAAAGEDLIEALHDFMTFVGKRVLIAHGSGHDKAFLNAALWRTSKVHLTHRLIDTMMIAKWLEPDRPSYGLDDLLESRGIDIRGRHHALEDARMTARLYVSFLQSMESRQVNTLGEMYAYLSRH